MKLSAPWVTYWRQLEALFARDPEVKVAYDGEANEIKLYVDNARKADALTQLLPTEKVFGNVTLKISVVPSNTIQATRDLLADAFAGNPAMLYIQHVESLIGSFDYAVFEPKVVQFFNDELSDMNGLRSTLYQDIAKEVFGDNVSVFFCTEPTAGELAKPLGEWP